jgi:heat shock protein HslJ
VLAAQQWLAAQLGVLAKDVKIDNLEQTQWPDSCLGLGRPNESCAQVVTPGWKAVFEVNGNTYEVRTDETGSTIRLAAQGGTPSAHAELENIFWNLVSFGPNGTEKPLVQGSRVTLLLADGKAGGFGGCNAYGGTYQITGNNQISFSQMTSTLMACADNNVTQQEQQYLQALSSASRYEVNGNSLRITYPQGVLVFEAANQAMPIPGLPSETATP